MNESRNESRNEPPRDCDPEILPLAVTGDLDAETAARVATHVASCSECAAELDALRAVVDGLLEIDARPTPADELAGFYAERVAPHVERRSSTRIWQRAAALALAFALGMVADRALTAERSSDPLAGTAVAAPDAASGVDSDPAPVIESRAAGSDDRRRLAYDRSVRARDGLAGGLMALAALGRDG